MEESVTVSFTLGCFFSTKNSAATQVRNSLASAVSSVCLCLYGREAQSIFWLWDLLDMQMFDHSIIIVVIIIIYYYLSLSFIAILLLFLLLF